jgi:hypothetical protein
MESWHEGQLCRVPLERLAGWSWPVLLGGYSALNLEESSFSDA